MPPRIAFHSLTLLACRLHRSQLGTTHPNNHHQRDVPNEALLVRVGVVVVVRCGKQTEEAAVSKTNDVRQG